MASKCTALTGKHKTPWGRARCPVHGKKKSKQGGIAVLPPASPGIAKPMGATSSASVEAEPENEFDVEVLEDGTRVTTMTNKASGRLKRVWYVLDGENHREDGPALVIYREDGSVASESYFVHGCPFRADGGPTEVKWQPNGYRKECFMLPQQRAGLLHRPNGPSEVIYDPKGEVTEERYLVVDISAGQYGPAIRETNERDFFRAWVVTVCPEISPRNQPAADFLDIQKDERTRAFIPPSPVDVEIALRLHENPA